MGMLVVEGGGQEVRGVIFCGGYWLPSLNKPKSILEQDFTGYGEGYYCSLLLLKYNILHKT